MPQGKKVTVVKKYSQFIHTNLTSAGSDDVFLTECDRSGNLVWVKQAGGANQDLGSMFALIPMAMFMLWESFPGTAIQLVRLHSPMHADYISHG
jgi:hypothetical protein